MHQENKFVRLSIFFLIGLIFLFPSCQKKEPMDQYIADLPQVENSLHRVKLEFTQPVNHKAPDKETFTQRVILNHVGYDRPTVVEFEGYGLYSKERGELAKILNANQITIEHRYFKESKPENPEWQYLTIWQAATDHHKIIQAFKDLYPRKWVSTGISKGGQATMYHRRFYPDDVTASVPYVAPLNYSKEDKRVYAFLDTLGSEECRQKILTFQKELFKRKKQLLEMFQTYTKKKDYQFTMGINRAYELNILEYPFAFWQWGKGKCEQIPGTNASNEELFGHLVSIADGSFFEKKGVAYNRPFFYQALTQIGMYGYEIEPFKQYLEDTSNITFDEIFPDIAHEPFDSSVMKDVRQWLKQHGDNMLYIYGGSDPWTATSFTPGKNTNAVKMVKPYGSHKTRIKSFSLSRRDSIYTTLENWLNVDINKNR